MISKGRFSRTSPSGQHNPMLFHSFSKLPNKEKIWLPVSPYFCGPFREPITARKNKHHPLKNAFEKKENNC